MEVDREAIDWSGVEESMARQILAQGHSFMEAQLQTALASDRRATTMASLFVTLALAVLAAGFGYWDKTQDIAPLLGGLTVGGFLIVAAVQSAWAARPVDFYFPGNQPCQWFAGRKNNIVEMIGGEAENYEERIEFNDTILGKSQQAIKRAFIFALLSPFGGVFAWLLPSIICSSCQA